MCCASRRSSIDTPSFANHLSLLTRSTLLQRSLSYFAWAAACAGLPLTLAAQPVPNPDLDLVHLVLNRVAFGPTPELTTRFLNTSSGTTVRQNLEAYIDQQINLTVDPNDPDYDDLLTASGSVQVQNLLLQQTGLPWLYPANQTSQATDAEIGNFSLIQPTASQLAHGIFSKWQLREVMCQFWERHFNTHLVGSSFWFFNRIPNPTIDRAKSYAWYYEWRANNFYRENALGTYRELLYFASKHVSMVAYLHQDQNKVQSPGDKPNEDFGRELLELYTMGQQRPGFPIENYDQTDVETVARILSGLSVSTAANDFESVFNAQDHDASPKPPLFYDDLAMPAGILGTELEIEWLLDELARHEATKDFICRKLMNEFLRDDAGSIDPVTLHLMKQAWGEDGYLPDVLNVMFRALLDNPGWYAGQRARMPLEAVLAPPRAFGATLALAPGDTFLGLSPTWLSLIDMGQDLLNFPAPIGYPTASAAQHSPHAALARIRLAATASLLPAPAITPLDYTAAVEEIANRAGQQWNDLTVVSGVALEMMYGTRYTLEDQIKVSQAMGNAAAYLVATNGSLDLSDKTTSDYRGIVRTAVITVMSMTQSAVH